MSSLNLCKFETKASRDLNPPLRQPLENSVQDLEIVSSQGSKSSRNNPLRLASDNENQSPQIIRNNTDENVINKMQNQSRVTNTNYY